MLPYEDAMSGINTGSLRLISQELIEDLERAFPGPTIDQNTPESKIKWDAAQKAVVDWIKSKAGQKQTVGNPSNEPGRPMPTGAMVRIGQ
ncbi:hypothetical protein EVB86_030 [Rhizobium phage RHph_Y2_7]|nr:hypothetical protein EVB86_030 [Rhizobium phage RHph_Y2_7]